MKALSETMICRNVTAFCKVLGRYNLGHDCDLTLSLYSGKSAEVPESTHRIKGSGRHNLFLLILLMGSGLLFIGLIKKLFFLLEK